VIGATGHIGTYLVPRLVAAGHEVVTISRGKREPYQADPGWSQVEQVQVDREAEEREGTFGRRIASLRPGAVVDLICFEVASARQLLDALRPAGSHLLHCGTIWVHGPGVEVPVPEEVARRPVGDYGTKKAAIEDLLLDASRRGDLPVTVLHPGHIVGPGWPPLNPAGNFNVEVFARLARGGELALPNLGLETVHHVHADDVAQAFALAVGDPGSAQGEAFHVVSERALTLRGYAGEVASWFGHEPRLSFAPWASWSLGWAPEDAEATWEHISRSPSMSMAKAAERLGYRPGYTSLQAVHGSLAWLVAQGRADTGGREQQPLR
jgi:nucleoside-diphosphate-sugar epimerase